MAFIGEIDHGSGLIASMPAGLLGQIGQDSKHYVLAFPSSGTITLDLIDPTPTSVWTLSQAQFEIDFATVSPGATGTANLKTAWGAPGEDVFFAVGFIDKGSHDEIAIVRYQIVDSSTINVFGGAHYATRGFIGSFRETPHCNGVATIGTQCYAVCNTGGTLFDFNGTFKCHLIELDLSGTDINLVSESWDTRITELPWEWGFLRATNDRPYYNRACIFEVEDGIRVDCYIGKTEVDGNGNGISPTIAALTQPSMLSTVADPATHTTPTGSTNVSSQYGLPFADIGLTFSGGVGTARDDYTSPNFCADGKLRMGRGNSEDSTLGRIRTFNLVTTGAGTVSPSTSTDYELDNVAPVNGQSIEFLQVFSDGSDIYWMVWADEFYAFGTVEDAVETEEPDECGPEDEADPELLCLFDWDECVLTPQDITVEIVSPTVSPGRSLSGREMVIQPDAGCFRVTLHGIPVWTNAQLLLWREYESALNGRVGTCCVPLYEAKLSSTPIAATLGANAAIGAVRLTINQTTGSTIRAGMHFQAGERAYRLVSGSGTAWKVWPPLRNAITSGTSLNFNDPRLRCRLSRDDAMDILLELLRFGRVTVNFVEDV